MEALSTSLRPLPAAVSQPSQVPELDQAGSRVHLVEDVLLVHALVAGQGQVLVVGGGPVGQRTPLQRPHRTPHEHGQVQTLRVGGADLEPGVMVTV